MSVARQISSKNKLSFVNTEFSQDKLTMHAMGRGHASKQGQACLRSCRLGTCAQRMHDLALATMHQAQRDISERLCALPLERRAAIG